VRIEVNGKPATLLVDTGAASTFVSAELAGVDASALGRSRFRADGGMEVSGIWERAKIALGVWRVSLEVKVIEMSTVSQRYGRRIDGLLGQDVLRRFERVMIDFGAKRLVLSEGE
jgi:predicted aspartyl protease